jgi:hypothetical protein
MNTRTTYELPTTKRFRVNFKEWYFDIDANRQIVNDYGIWQVTHLITNESDELFFIIIPTVDAPITVEVDNEPLPITVTADELRITKQTGHRKHCIGAALHSQITTLLDEPAVSATDFGDALQANVMSDDCIPTGPYEMTVDGLNDGTLHCICLTTEGLI